MHHHIGEHSTDKSDDEDIQDGSHNSAATLPHAALLHPEHVENPTGHETGKESGIENEIHNGS